MRHRVDGRKFGRPTAHRVAMFRNLVSDLLRHEHVVTTEPKAKEVRGLAEKMITLGKDGSLESRRRAIAYVFDSTAIEKLFGVLASRYADRHGGYTRLSRLGRRMGDGAMMARLELVP